MTNKELVLRHVDLEIKENLDFIKDLINKNTDPDYTDHVLKPTFALLELGQQYMINHYDLIKPLENVFNTDKEVMEQLKDLSITTHTFIMDFYLEIEVCLEDTFFDNANLNLNFKDIILQYID